MNEMEARALFRALTKQRTPADRRGCPPPEALRALVERQGDETLRLRTLDHVMACAACRPEFELLRAAAKAAESRSRVALPVGLAAAAALAVLLSSLLIWRVAAPGGDVVRGGGGALQLVAPAGAVETVPTLTWRAVDGALRYEIEVARAGGAPVFQATLRDTTVAVPAGALAAGQYVWWVEAVRLNGRLRSAPSAFEVRR